MQRFLLVLTLVATLSGCATVRPAFTVDVAPMIVLSDTSGRTDVTLTNRGRRVARRVTVRCQFFDAAGQLKQKGVVYYSNLAPGAAATNPVFVDARAIARGDCAVDPKGR